MSGSPNEISVVVCTRNRADVLGDCLNSLRSQDLPGECYEILVVDDGSTDETPTLVAKASQGSQNPRIRYLRQEQKGLSAARNHAVREAGGDLICFIDDDAVAEKHWLPAVDAGTSRYPETDCFVGRIFLSLEGKAPRSCGREYFAGYFDAGDLEHESTKLMGGNMFLRRRIFDRVGLFDETLVWRGDEDEWFGRVRSLGGTAMYLPDATIWHRRLAHELRLSHLLKTKFGWGVAQVQYKRAAGLPFSYTKELWGMAFALLHVLRRGCLAGLMTVATHAGAFWAALRGELKSPQRSSATNFRHDSSRDSQDSRPFARRRGYKAT
jgi:glucosyl-dolichyl phosphate glucuronosyltransferase